jgi:hypothetical protein
MGAVNAEPDRNAMVLAALRIAVGVLFLVFGQYKVFGTQFTLGGGFQSWINRFLADGAYPFMAPILRNFVLPHGTVIAFLVAYGELESAWGSRSALWCARRVRSERSTCWPCCSPRTTLVRTRTSGNTLAPRSTTWC